MNLESTIKESYIFKGFKKNKMPKITNTIKQSKNYSLVLFIILLLFSIFLFFNTHSIINDESLDRSCRLVNTNAEYKKGYFPNNIICKQNNKIFEIKKNVKLNHLGD